MADLGLRKMISDNKVTQLEGQSTEQVMPAKNDRNKEEHSEPGTTVLMRVGVAVIDLNVYGKSDYSMNFIICLTT